MKQMCKFVVSGHTALADICCKPIIWFPCHNLVVRASGGAVNLQSFTHELLKLVEANLACKCPRQVWPGIGNSVCKQVLNHYYPLIDHATRQAGIIALPKYRVREDARKIFASLCSWRI